MHAQEISVLLEQTEASGWLKLFDQAHSCRLQDAILCASPGLDILAYNRVVGLGTEQSFSSAVLSEIIDWYSLQGVPRFMLALSPFTLNTDAEHLLVQAGFRPHNYWAKLFAPLEKLIMPGISPEMEISPALPAENKQFSHLIAQAFDWPDALAPVLLRMFHNPSYRIFFARLNGMPVAAGALYHHGTVATMAIAGTLPNYRGYGAQKALLHKRIEVAKQLNCRFLATETGKDSDEKPNLSFRNMQKLGLQLLYHRRNYVFEFGGGCNG